MIETKYIRAGEILDLTTVLSLISDDYKTEILNNKEVRVFSKRLQMFKEKGVECVFCGIKGSFFAVESYTGVDYHLNLYAKDGNKEILMTKDHIVPKTRGGSNYLDNLNPACLPCNQKKSNTYPYKLK